MSDLFGGINPFPQGLTGGAVSFGENTAGDEIIQHMIDQQNENQKQKIAEKKSDEARRKMLLGYIGDQFNDRDYLTGTPEDPIISNTIQGMKDKYSKMLVDNPKIDLADMNLMIRKDISQLSDWSQRAKDADRQIKESANALTVYKGLDAKAATDIAKKMYFLKQDEKGNDIPRNASELPANPGSFVDMALDQHPEKVLGAVENPYEMMGRVQTFKTRPILKVRYNGLQKDVGYTADLFPFQEAQVIDNKPQVVTKSQPLLGPDGKAKLDKGGKPIQILPDDIYTAFYNSPDQRVRLNARLKQAGLIPTDENRKIFAFSELNQIQPKEFTPINNSLESDWRGKQRAGLIGGGKKENDVDTIFRAASGDQSILSNLPSVKINGTDYKDISGGAVHGIVIRKDAGKNIYGKVLAVPGRPGELTVFELDKNGKVIDGTQQVLTGPDIKKFVVGNVAGNNSSSVQDASTRAKKYFDQSGNLIPQSPTTNPAVPLKTTLQKIMGFGADTLNTIKKWGQYKKQ